MKPINHYHAHVYFEPDTRAQAIRLREELAQKFSVQTGRVHDKPVGPHTRGMFQVLLDQAAFNTVVPWLMANRDGLNILVHGDTGDDLTDHTRHAMWLGESLPLNLSVFEKDVNTGP